MKVIFVALEFFIVDIYYAIENCNHIFRNMNFNTSQFCFKCIHKYIPLGNASLIGKKNGQPSLKIRWIESTVTILQDLSDY